MRFEAKHNYFKKLVERINNFKNISYSLARRHQALQAYLLQSSTGSFLRMTLDVGPGQGCCPGGVRHDPQYVMGKNVVKMWRRSFPA